MAEKIYTEAPEAPVRVSPLVGMSIGDLVKAMVTGAGVGVIAAAVAMLMYRFVFAAVLCRTAAGADCTQAPVYAIVVAIVVGAIVGTVVLARLRVFRPLLVVLTTAIALWTVHVWALSIAWYWGLLVTAVLYGLSYGLFAWVARIRSFILSLVVTIVLVVGLRLLLQR